MDDSLYDGDSERDQHWHVIEMLAQEFGVSTDEVGPLYEAELAKLKPGARIKDYLSILISHNVREHIRAVRHGHRSG
ncbi:MAG: DUF3562 domain-containing protein [Pseudomonadota bacterium]